ncbi:hypothetical protein HUU51_02985 [Candidatus Gracilibacteria bacterium]|nr:hypothetical protein [Candidatus Gracilibacteria bacterium]
MSLDRLKSNEVSTSNERQISPETRKSPEAAIVSSETREKLKTISSREFLKIPESERLRYITKSQIDSTKISSGEIKEIEFNFTFDSKINRELYLKTTAGQVLPKEVREVKVGNEIYTRIGLKGEFFNSRNTRLTIHQDTRLEISKIGDIKELEKQNQNIFTSFKSENISKKDSGKDYIDLETTNYDDLLKGAIDKGIDPGFAIFVFGDEIKSLPLLSTDRQVRLEELLTDYHRIRNNLPNWNGNILEESEQRNNFVLALLKETCQNWKEKAKEYGIKEEKINLEERKTNNISLIDFTRLTGTNLNGLDFRPLSYKYPREASIKNNNPAGLTWNPSFAKTLDNYGINYYKGTSRPSIEGGNYFGFPNMEEGLNAFNLLWDIKLNRMGDKTFGQFAQNWAVDYTPYRNTFGNVWNTKLSDLDQKTIDTIKSAQMRIESPGMHRELSNIGVIV